MFEIPRGFVLEPADLGFNNLTIALSTTITGPIFPLLQKGPITRVSFIVDTGPTAATPFNFSLGAGAWNPGDSVSGPTLMGNFSTFLQNVPNNPRIKHAVFGDVGATAGGHTNGGTVLSAGAANVLAAPFAALRIANSDAVNAATNVFAWIALQF